MSAHIRTTHKPFKLNYKTREIKEKMHKVTSHKATYVFSSVSCDVANAVDLIVFKFHLIKLNHSSVISCSFNYFT